MEIHTKVLDGKASNTQSSSCEHLQAGSCRLLLLHCQTILGLKPLTVNKVLPKIARGVAESGIPHLSDFHLVLGAGNKGDQSCRQLSFAFPNNAAAPDRIHNPNFCPHTGRDGCLLPRWQNHHDCFTTAIAWWTSGRTTPRAHQVSTARHQAKRANQPEYPRRGAL